MFVNGFFFSKLVILFSIEVALKQKIGWKKYNNQLTK